MLKPFFVRFQAALQTLQHRVRRWARPQSRLSVGLALDQLRYFSINCAPTFVIELASRRVVDSAAIRSPASASVTQQLRERFLRSARVECLDHMVILGETSLASILRRCCRYVNGARPHQGIRQQLPDALATNADSDRSSVAIPMLGGFHHEYRRAAQGGCAK